VRSNASFPVRLRFCKRGKVRFISHRDVARAFDRAFRIEQLPLAFTEGFAPRPRVSFGLALSVGHESDAEYLDVELAGPVDRDRLTAGLSVALPDGIDVIGAEELDERAPALQESVTTVEYRVGVIDLGGASAAPGRAAAAVDRALSLAALPVPRKRKGREVTDDLRPVIRRLAVVGADGGTVLEMELTTQPRGTRPNEVLVALDDDLDAAWVLRTHQWIERDGARLEPLEADSRRRVPEVRVS
jgi:radical SAM-linked protein